jgi:hypothetical protein
MAVHLGGRIVGRNSVLGEVEVCDNLRPEIEIRPGTCLEYTLTELANLVLRKLQSESIDDFK